jgi:lysine 6-dehydrogenase
MRFLVLGAGSMGRAVAFDLCRRAGVGRVLLADSDPGRAREAKAFTRSDRAAAVRMDVTDHDRVVEAMRGIDAAVSCVPYRFNLGLAKAAVEAGCSLVDLGGNNDVVRRELALDKAARRAGVTIIPDCGLAPGLVSVLSADALGRFDRVDELHLRVGGLPLHPRPPLDYMMVFSAAGLINEYVEPAVVIRGGKVRTVASLDDLEVVVFPEPFGSLEAFNTSGGTSTLPRTLLDKVKELDYKTIRYRGHCERVRLLRDLGLFDASPVAVDGGGAVAPRAVMEALLSKRLSFGEDDVVLVRVQALGSKGGRKRTLTYTIIDRGDRAAGLTAMMRMTAFPASIVAQMIASGEIAQKGALPQELVVPTKSFLRQLKARGVRVGLKWDR